MRIIFFGTPPFAAEVLHYLLEKKVEVCAVVTKVDKPRGRSGKPQFSAVKQYVLEKGYSLPIYQPDRASKAAFVEELARYGADLFVVVAYGEIVKQSLLDLPKYDCINLHASLLPKYRGAAPIHFALLKGEEETGVTIIEMTAKMDAGPILAQQVIPITAEEQFLQVEEKLCIAGAQLLFEVIQEYEKGKVRKIEQKGSEVTYATKVDPALAQLDWNQSATILHNRIRAFTPRPGAWCRVIIGKAEKRLKVSKSRVLSLSSGKIGETLAYSKQGWAVACAEDALEILELQIEGKKRLSIAEFMCGMQTPPVLL